MTTATASTGTWDGKEVVRDGVRHVLNPATSIDDPITVRLQERWRVGEGDDEEVFFGMINGVAVDAKGNTYLLDTQMNEVMVFSPGGEYLRSIGREGEGPGEFRRGRSLCLTGSGDVAVLQTMPGKIVLLTTDGDPIGNHPLPDADGMQLFTDVKRAGDGVAICKQLWIRDETGFSIIASLVRVDAKGNQTARYWEDSYEQDAARMVFDEKTTNPAPTWAVAPDGRVFVCPDFDAYRVEIHTPDGSLDCVIEREFTPRKRTKDEMERRGPLVRVGQAQTEVVKSQTDRSILAVFPRSDKTVWVLNSRGAFDTSDGEIATVDAFDADGRLTRQITLLGEGDRDTDVLNVIGNRLYVLKNWESARIAWFGADQDVDEEDLEAAEPMYVIVYDLDNVVQSRNELDADGDEG